MRRLLLVSLCLWLCSSFVMAGDAPAQLPNTQPLTWDDDLADRMMDGLHRFVERKIEHAVANRQQFWKRDTSSPDAYEKSIAPNRERLKKLIGVIDRRIAPQLEVFVPGEPIVVAQDGNGRAMRARWLVFDGVTGEGLIVVPNEQPVATVILLPDAGQTPEDWVLKPDQHFVWALAAMRIQVIVPTLIDRSDEWSGSELVAFTNQPHREWIWRQAYHMGRHILGLEVQKVSALVDAVRQTSPNHKIAVAGYGEGGLVAMLAAAVDPRLDGCLVSGYFGPHARPWEEPIERHIWSFHREFGDAELATLIAPRPLVVEHSPVPRVEGPPTVRPGRRGGASLGKLETPSFDAVKAEFDRIGTLVPKEFAKSELTELKSDRKPASPLAVEATVALLKLLGHEIRLAELPARSVPSSKFDPSERQRRQVLELERFTQRLVRESDHTRDKFFPVTTLAQQAKAEAAKDPMKQITASAKFSDSTAKFREYFRDEVLGKFDDPLLPFNARSRKIYDKEKWVGYDVVLDVFPDVFAWGVLLLPKDLKPGEKRPVVVCQHGRNGVPKVVIENDEKAYHDYAAKLAERGFIVFAPHNPYRGEDKYRFLSRKANCVKGSLFSFILAQHEQILNWLSSLPQVDPDRIAFYGLSYGGETAVRIPPLLLPSRQPNVAGAALSSDSPLAPQPSPLPGYCLSICSADFNDWARKVCSTDAKYSFMFTVEWEMPYFDMGSTFNYAEMVALLAPRPFMVERGHWDGVAPDEWVAYEYAKVRRLYDTLGLGDRTDIEFFDGLHEINGQGTFEFLHKHLKRPKP